MEEKAILERSDENLQENVLDGNEQKVEEILPDQCNQEAIAEQESTKKRGKLGCLIAIGIALLVLVAGGLGAYFYMRSVVSKVHTVSVDTEQLDALESEGVINIALYGIDGTTTSSGRSDAIMIFTLDLSRKNARLCSIMRDSYVNIEGHGMDKINHAYSYGGPELAMKTLNQNFGLNITHFAAVDFEALPEIVNMLGGVDIEITAEEVSTGQIPNVTAAGLQTLNGKQALAYSRIRYASGNDYQRTQRQRNVINEMIKKILQQPVSNWPDLVSKIAPLITTNYATDEIISMAVKYGTYVQHGIKETRFPIDGECEGKIIDGVYYLTFDIPTLAQRIQDFVFEGIMP